MKSRLAGVAALAAPAALLLGCATLNHIAAPPPPTGSATTSNASSSAGESATPTPEAGATKSDPLGLGGLGQQMNGVGLSAGNTAQWLQMLSRVGPEAVENIDERDERAVGQESAIKLISQNGGLVLDDAPLLDYVNDVANLVGEQGKRLPDAKGKVRVPDRRFLAGILDNPDMNAFSLPGGYVFVTRGLLQGLGSESELGFVLGHEIAHCDHEHGLKALKVEVGSNAFLKTLIHIDTTRAPTDADARAMVSFDDPNFLGRTAAFLAGWVPDREAEREADADGLRYAIAAGYDAQGAGRVLRLLSSKPPKSGPFSFLKDHDTPEARFQLLRPSILAAPKGDAGAERFDQRCTARLDAIAAARGEKAQGAGGDSSGDSWNQ